MAPVLIALIAGGVGCLFGCIFRAAGRKTPKPEAFPWAEALSIDPDADREFDRMMTAARAKQINGRRCQEGQK